MQNHVKPPRQFLQNTQATLKDSTTRSPTLRSLTDEPTASMDAAATRQAEELLNRWVRGARYRASVWTSHDADQVSRVADRTLTLDGTSSRP